MQLLDISERQIDLLLSAMLLGHDPRNRPAVTRDYDCFATYNLVEQLGKVGFGIGGLNFACHRILPIGRFDRSIWT